MAYTTIDDPHKFFNIILWTGDGTGNRSLTGVGFQPDWVWTKLRSTAGSHQIYDIVRGATKDLESDNANAESTSNEDGFLNSFDSDGFTMNDGSSSDFYGNDTGKTYVAWNWLAGGSTSSNGDGSITSTVSVNSTSGFSIVSYVGGGASSATVGHGLGATPAMIIVKNRSITEEWRVWHQNLSGSTYKVSLNSSGAQDSSATVFNGQSSTTFTVGNDPSVSGSGNNIIAYCFKEVKGYSKFGGYTGNGSTSGPFVYTGFKPAFVLMKRTNGSNSWNIFDNKRAIDNPVQHRLFPDTSDAEATSTGNAVDFLSNGFVGRSSGSTVNADGGTYIYMAFAEQPFKYSNAR